MEVAKRSARGSAVLFVGNLTAAVFAAAASVIIARLLGPADFGLYSLSLVMPALLQLLAHFGTRTAVTRYVAYHLSLGEVEKAKRFSQAAVLFSLIAGGAFTILSYVSSWWVASYVFLRPDLQPFIALASLAVFGQSMLMTAIVAAVGWNAMGQASFGSAFQSATKMVLSPLLIFLGFGVTGAVVGHAGSMVVGGAAAVFLLYSTKIKLKLDKFSHFVEDTKELVRFGFYPFIGNILTGLSTFYVSFLLAVVASDTLIGYYQAASNLIVPASLLSSAIASALYPAFSSLHGTKSDTASAVTLSLKYAGYLVLPLLFFLAAASTQLLYVFYGTSFTPGSGYLVLIAVAYAPVLFGPVVLPGFFNALGLTKRTLLTTGTAAAALLGLAPLLAVSLGLGVKGLIYALLLSNVVFATVGLLHIRWGRLGVIDWRSSAATFAASLAAFGTAWALPSLGHPTLLLAGKFGVFMTVYLTLAPLLGALTPADVDRLSESVHTVTLVWKLVGPIAVYERYLAARRPGSSSN